MLKVILSRQLGRFERTWSYDAGYLRRLLAASPVSVLKFGLVSGVAPRAAAPLAALAAAEIVATLSEDCGPCIQLAVDRAAVAGIAPGVLRAILNGDQDAMGSEAAVAWRFARATLDRDLPVADRLRDEILTCWGERGLAALALTLTAARLYPTLKFALGHSGSCAQVVVDGQPVIPAQNVGFP